MFKLHQMALFAWLACGLSGCEKSMPAAMGDATADFVKPNIVLVMTDDQGYGDLSYYHNPIVQTPNIDALAKQSVRLEDYHVSPTCSPTRAALLTGHWANRTGVWHTIMGRSMLRQNETTIASILKQNGYHTGMIGKWHLGDNYPYRPMDKGFDFSYYHGGGGVGQTPDLWDNAYFDGQYYRNGVAEPANGYVTDILFDEAMHYIDRVKARPQPFFLYLSTNAPHGPMHAPTEYAKRYSGKGLTTEVQHFYAMMTNIDDNVAKLRRYLKQNNLEQNTIFIYTTDNGTELGHNIYNAGMRGKKSSQYDGGHRVPFFIYWPDGGLNEGRSVERISAHVDVVPTLLSLSQSAFVPKVAFDGVDLSPLLRNPNAPWPDRILVTDSQRVLNPIKWQKSAVMTQQWRLIDGQALYDIQADPAQANDVAAHHPEVVSRLRQFYDNWWQELVPTFGEPTAIYLGDDKANPSLLTSHDWLGDNARVPWNQAHIRRGLREKDGKHKGYWWVNVVQPGVYEIELSRWPKSLNLPIRAPLAPGEPVPGERAFRMAKGVAFNATRAFIEVGDTRYEQPVSAEATSVTFKVNLAAGQDKLVATFVDDKQQEMGSYFVSVTRL